VTRVAVTSQVRFAGQAAYSGVFRVVDLDSGRTLLNEPVPESRWRQIDPNPRGGLRGAKGISVAGDRLVVANSDTVFVLDRSWRVIAEFTHPFTGSIHDLLAEDEAIWVTCTNGDLLLKLDWDGRELDRWCWRHDRNLVTSFGLRSPPAFDPGIDYRNPRELQGGVHNVVHLNAVSRAPEGLLLSFGRVLSPAEIRRRRLRAVPGRLAARLGVQRRTPTKPAPLPTNFMPGSSSAIVLLRDAGAPLERATAEVLLRVENVVVPNHNVLQTGELLLYVDSNESRLVAVNRATGRERSSVAIPGAPAFARGLAALEGDLYLVGSQAPLALHVVDMARGEIAASYELDGAENESVYAVCVIPSGFADPGETGGVFRKAPEQVAS
jgi:hypothetical protein